MAVPQTKINRYTFLVPWGTSNIHSDFEFQFQRDQDLPFFEGILKLYHSNIFIIRNRRNWKDGSHCSKCQILFSRLKSPKKHCYHCGEVLCQSCLVYRRRLDRNGKPSRTGVSCPVCLNCSEDGSLVQPMGVYHSHFEKFSSLRGTLKPNERLSLETLPNLRKFNSSDHDKTVLRRLEQLLVSYSQRGRSVHLRKGELDWQKSNIWPHLEDSRQCGYCQNKLSRFSSKIHCRLCGAMHCHRHATKTLALYTGDQNESKWALKDFNEPLAIPKGLSWLYCCVRCYDDIKLFTRKQDVSDRDTPAEKKQFFTAVVNLQQKLREKQKVVGDFLIFFGDKVDELEQTAKSKNQSSEIESDLRKIYFELSATFNEIVDIILALQKLKACNTSQDTLLQNITLGVKSFYNKFILSYRIERSSLQKLLPDFESISKLHDASKDQLVAVHHIIVQMNFELAEFAKRFPLLKGFIYDGIVRHLNDIKEIIEEDLEPLLVTCKDSAQRHQESVQDIVQQELRDNDEILSALTPTEVQDISTAKSSILFICVRKLNWCQNRITKLTAKVQSQETRNIIESKLINFTSMIAFL